MNFSEYLMKVSVHVLNNADERFGQAAFNVLREVDPVLAEEIRGTDLDPFYDEICFESVEFKTKLDILDKFFEFLQERWENE